MLSTYQQLLMISMLMYLFSATSHADETVHLGTNIPSKSQIIELLSPKKTVRKKVTTRGLQLNPGFVHTTATSAEMEPEKEDQRSISLIINFEFDSAELTADAESQLVPLAEALTSNELSTLFFELEGHTDASGSTSYNLDLSNRRASTVKDFLTKRYALDPNRVAARGKGETQLLQDISPHSEENRRVVVIAK